jgi:hypothetical protein
MIDEKIYRACPVSEHSAAKCDAAGLGLTFWERYKTTTISGSYSRTDFRTK